MYWNTTDENELKQLLRSGVTLVGYLNSGGMMVMKYDGDGFVQVARMGLITTGSTIDLNSHMATDYLCEMIDGRQIWKCGEGNAWTP